MSSSVSREAEATGRPSVSSSASPVRAFSPQARSITTWRTHQPLTIAVPA